MANGEPRSLEYTPTWVVTVVCFIIVLISFGAERGLRKLGKFFKHKEQKSLFKALQEVKGELMLLGFISLLLTVFQGPISRICIPPHAANIMLPCKLKTEASSGGSEHLDIIKHGRRLLAEDVSLETCARQGKLPLLSLEALHQLHIFIFVLAVVHVIFCATIVLLGRAKIKQWKPWEDSIRSEMQKPHDRAYEIFVHRIFEERAGRQWEKSTVVSWMVSFFRQFHGSVTKSDYIVLREGFIRAQCPSVPHFDFHAYMLRTLEHDFKKIVRIRWYLWVFAMIFLLMDLAGWHSYFWLSFLPLVLLLLVGAKLEHIITELAKGAAEQRNGEAEAPPVTPSDELFWFHSPTLFLYLIHFILFQNSFGIAFLFWVWTTYGLKSCIMEKLGFIIPRLTIGILVQVLCSYSTLPLYALVTQMGSMFKQGMIDEYIQKLISKWTRAPSSATGESHRLASQSADSIHASEHPTLDDAIATSVIELNHHNESQTPFS
ncbi:MLO-like protein 13 [Coffea eugenioides]|uniref:MLO-like protein 13 n=1 Tax=Coffea eugenioides TaxID=49369 RepID=UPI000F60989C|nr:MLO-like protein 13 [Coffea eugenioides]